MINLQKWEDWKESLSEEDVVKSYDKFGSMFQVPETTYFGFNKIRENSISPFSGYLRSFDRQDFFDGRGISVVGYSYLEGVLDKEKDALKMIEFYELPHSRGDWCTYDVDLKSEKGKYEHFREGRKFDEGSIGIVSLVNDFSLNRGLDGLGFSDIVRNGLRPKKLTEFWNDLKNKGFSVPLEYYDSQENGDFYNKSSDEIKDDLPF